METTQLVGIDVSNRQLNVCIQRTTKESVQTLTLANRRSGHQQLIRRLDRSQHSARVVLEATGVYSLDLVLALHRAPGIEVMVVNPRAARDFARAHLKRSKTDATDSAILLEYARRMEFRPWEPPAPEVFQLREITRRCAALTRLLTQEKNRLHVATRSRELSAIVRNDIEVNIRHLTRRLDRLERQAQELVEKESVLEGAMSHLVSIRGISRRSGLRILGELAALPADMNVRQWVAHRGLDPRKVQSGTSVNRPARISKVGNKYLRAALYMPALVATQAEPNVRAFYDMLVDRGKTAKQAVVAVMRKLLHAIYGMLKHDADFDGDKFYELRAQKA